MPIANEKQSFNDWNIASAPGQNGVYALWDNFGVIYYGSSSGATSTIRERLQAHKAGRHGPCTQNATHFQAEVCLYPLAREKQLLDEHERQFGRLPRCNDVMP
jgi:hypothetical protein